MRKYWLPFVLAFLLLGSSGLYAEVILTDVEAKELEETLDALETNLIEQQQTISDLRMRNEELENHLTELEKQADERQNLSDEQETIIKTAKSSWIKRNLFSLVHDILISIGFGIVGLLVGMLLL